MKADGDWAIMLAKLSSVFCEFSQKAKWRSAEMKPTPQQIFLY